MSSSSNPKSLSFMAEIIELADSDEDDKPLFNKPPSGRPVPRPDDSSSSSSSASSSSAGVSFNPRPGRIVDVLDPRTNSWVPGKIESRGGQFAFFKFEDDSPFAKAIGGPEIAPLYTHTVPPVGARIDVLRDSVKGWDIATVRSIGANRLVYFRYRDSDVLNYREIGSPDIAALHTHTPRDSSASSAVIATPTAAATATIPNAKSTEKKPKKRNAEPKAAKPRREVGDEETEDEDEDNGTKKPRVDTNREEKKEEEPTKISKGQVEKLIELWQRMKSTYEVGCYSADWNWIQSESKLPREQRDAKKKLNKIAAVRIQIMLGTISKAIHSHMKMFEDLDLMATSVNTTSVDYRLKLDKLQEENAIPSNVTLVDFTSEKDSEYYMEQYLYDKLRYIREICERTIDQPRSQVILARCNDALGFFYSTMGPYLVLREVCLANESMWKANGKISYPPHLGIADQSGAIALTELEEYLVKLFPKPQQWKAFRDNLEKLSFDADWQIEPVQLARGNILLQNDPDMEEYTEKGGTEEVPNSLAYYWADLIIEDLESAYKDKELRRSATRNTTLVKWTTLLAKIWINNDTAAAGSANTNYGIPYDFLFLDATDRKKHTLFCDSTLEFTTARLGAELRGSTYQAEYTSLKDILNTDPDKNKFNKLLVSTTRKGPIYANTWLDYIHRVSAVIGSWRRVLLTGYEEVVSGDQKEEELEAKRTERRRGKDYDPLYTYIDDDDEEEEEDDNEDGDHDKARNAMDVAATAIETVADLFISINNDEQYADFFLDPLIRPKEKLDQVFFDKNMSDFSTFLNTLYMTFGELEVVYKERGASDGINTRQIDKALQHMEDVQRRILSKGTTIQAFIADRTGYFLELKPFVASSGSTSSSSSSDRSVIGLTKAEKDQAMRDAMLDIEAVSGKIDLSKPADQAYLKNHVLKRERDIAVRKQIKVKTEKAAVDAAAASSTSTATTGAGKQGNKKETGSGSARGLFSREYRSGIGLSRKNGDDDTDEYIDPDKDEDDFLENEGYLYENEVDTDKQVAEQAASVHTIWNMKFRPALIRMSKSIYWTLERIYSDEDLRHDEAVLKLYKDDFTKLYFDEMRTKVKREPSSSASSAVSSIPYIRFNGYIDKEMDSLFFPSSKTRTFDGNLPPFDHGTWNTPDMQTLVSNMRSVMKFQSDRPDLSDEAVTEITEELAEFDRVVAIRNGSLPSLERMEMGGRFSGSGNQSDSGLGIGQMWADEDDDRVEIILLTPDVVYQHNGEGDESTLSVEDFTARYKVRVNPDPELEEKEEKKKKKKEKFPYSDGINALRRLYGLLMILETRKKNNGRIDKNDVKDEWKVSMETKEDNKKVDKCFIAIASDGDPARAEQLIDELSREFPFEPARDLAALNTIPISDIPLPSEPYLIRFPHIIVDRLTEVPNIGDLKPGVTTNDGSCGISSLLNAVYNSTARVDDEGALQDYRNIGVKWTIDNWSTVFNLSYYADPTLAIRSMIARTQIPKTFQLNSLLKLQGIEEDEIKVELIHPTLIKNEFIRIFTDNRQYIDLDVGIRSLAAAFKVGILVITVPMESDGHCIIDKFNESGYDNWCVFWYTPTHTGGHFQNAYIREGPDHYSWFTLHDIKLFEQTIAKEKRKKKGAGDPKKDADFDFTKDSSDEGDEDDSEEEEGTNKTNRVVGLTRKTNKQITQEWLVKYPRYQEGSHPALNSTVVYKRSVNYTLPPIPGEKMRTSADFQPVGYQIIEQISIYDHPRGFTGGFTDDYYLLRFVGASGSSSSSSSSSSTLSDDQQTLFRLCFPGVDPTISNLNEKRLSLPIIPPNQYDHTATGMWHVRTVVSNGDCGPDVLLRLFKQRVSVPFSTPVLRDTVRQAIAAAFISQYSSYEGFNANDIPESAPDQAFDQEVVGTVQRNYWIQGDVALSAMSREYSLGFVVYTYEFKEEPPYYTYRADVYGRENGYFAVVLLYLSKDEETRELKGHFQYMTFDFHDRPPYVFWFKKEDVPILEGKAPEGTGMFQGFQAAVATFNPWKDWEPVKEGKGSKSKRARGTDNARAGKQSKSQRLSARFAARYGTSSSIKKDDSQASVDNMTAILSAIKF